MNARLVVVPAIAVITGLVLWWTRAPGVPAATWRTGDGSQTGRNYGELPPETPVLLSFTCTEPRFVYVFSHSETDGLLLLFPSPAVRSDLGQPLAAGSFLLPGKRDDKQLAWNTRRQVLPTTTFLVVAARESVTELDALLPKLRRWTNTALTSGAMDVTNPPVGTEVAAGAHQPLPDPLLQRAADRSLTETVVNGPMAADPQRPGTWIGSWRVKEASSQK